MRVLLTVDARADIRTIRERRAEFSPGRADDLVLELLRRLRQIRDFPRLGRIVPELQHEDLREVLEQGYRIIYQVFPDRAEVFAVLHSRQDIRPPR